MNKIELINNISNQEKLKDKIHEIHNYLRNSGAGYGMNAMKYFNIIYGLKKITEKNLLDKVTTSKSIILNDRCNEKIEFSLPVNLCPECNFSYILDLANNNKHEELSGVFKQILDSIYASNLNKFLFYEIPKNINGNILSYLIKEIDNITIIENTCNVLLSGKIYEYFMIE